MKVVAPQPLTYKGGERAVLLLHGFTGSTLDVRNLGRHLQDKGFTCHAPLYKGHGLSPEKLVQTGPKDWWQNVIGGYHYLKEEGYQDIAVAGISLGGVFSIKLGAELPVKGVVSMSAPAMEKKVEELNARVLQYIKRYRKFEGRNVEEIEAEIKKYEQTPMPSLKGLQALILETSRKIHQIKSPTFVLFGAMDEPLYKESAEIIYENVSSEEKQLKKYEQSGHLITLGKEREHVYEDVFTFLNELDW